MPLLSEVVADAAKKPLLVNDCVQLIEAEVDDRGGLTGFAIKAAYKAVKGIKPGFVPEVVNDLLPEFAKALEPLINEGQSSGRPLTSFLESNAGRAADALLGITDAKARHARNPVAKGAYERLRGTAKKNVEQAIPRLARLVTKYTT